MLNQVLSREKLWRSESRSSRIPNPALNGGEWSASRPGRFTAGKRVSDSYWIGRWVRPRTGLHEVTKREITDPAKNRTPVIQHVT
jgi:hypothetical protein